MLSKHQLLFDQHAERACIGLADCAETVCRHSMEVTARHVQASCRSAGTAAVGGTISNQAIGPVCNHGTHVWAMQQ